MHSTCNGRSPMLVPLLSPPHTPSASPASTTLFDPHVCRVLACMTPRMCSTCSSHSPSPAPWLLPPCPPLPCPAPGYPLPQSQLMSGTGSTTCSIAGARSKCNEHSPLPTPSSSPPWALHLSSTPTPATTRNLGLPHCEQDGYHLLCAAHTAAVPPFSHALPLPPSILSPILPCLLMALPGGFPSPAPAVFAAVTVPQAGIAQTTWR
jgi:hypothetical protein